MRLSNFAPNFLLEKPVPSTTWEKLFLSVFRRGLDQNGIKALLLLLSKKGEGASEIWGCLRAVRRVEPPHHVPLPSVMDVCGTGGDGKHTFNISTVSSFVIAGAGAYVAKHGNRSVSSRVGSSDLMEGLGVRWEIPFSQMVKALRQCHLGYFHAPLYHSSFTRIQKARRELKVGTLFNVIGPLINPIELQCQMIGVSNPMWLKPVAEALKKLRRRRAAVFHGLDGLDELSTRATSDILCIEGGRMSRFRLNPRHFGFAKAGKSSYEGGGLKTNREIALRILENQERGPRQDVVLLNSGFALWLAGLSPTVEEGVERSRWAIRVGRARSVLDALRRATKRQVSL